MTTPKFGNIQTFNQKGFEGGYCAHPAPEVDLACINVSILTRTDVFFKCLGDDFLEPIDYDESN